MIGTDSVQKLLARAAALKQRFNEEFWMPDKQYHAMALDGHHRQVDTITSNPGHCLWTGLIDKEHAEAVAGVLVSDPTASAWGIRAMSLTEKAFNPLSYHNGSVWPFENALIATGLKSYGFPCPFPRPIDIRPSLPENIEWLTARNLSVAGGHISLSIVRAADGTVQLHVLENSDCLEVTILPIIRGKLVQQSGESAGETAPAA